MFEDVSGAAPPPVARARLLVLGGGSIDGAEGVLVAGIVFVVVVAGAVSPAPELVGVAGGIASAVCAAVGAGVVVVAGAACAAVGAAAGAGSGVDWIAASEAG